jgi:predicted nucleic acid-binding Zn ribbon protein
VADEADKANDHMERELALRIRAARSVQAVDTTGACFFCGEDVGSGVRFCSKDCADDWEREHEIRRKQGLR